jgi:hypothetical protein
MNWNIVAGYAKSIWAVAGPLLDVLVGAYIANRNQRKHWIADCKKETWGVAPPGSFVQYLPALRERSPRSRALHCPSSEQGERRSSGRPALSRDYFKYETFGP